MCCFAFLMAFFCVCGLAFVSIPESRLLEEGIPIYNELAFFLGFLPPLVYLAGAWGVKEHTVANWKSILARSFVSKLISFATVSLGTALFLPKLGIGSLAITDYLAIGAIFVPNNLIFAVPVGPPPKGHNYDESGPMFADGAISIASSIILLKTIKGLDLSSRAILPRVILFAIGKIVLILVASPLLGIFVGWLVSFHGLLAKNIKITPELVIDHNGCLRRGHEGPTIILFFLSIPTFLLAEFLNLSGTLSVFFYAITTTHYLWPTVTENSIIWREELHNPSIFIKLLLHMWIGLNVTRMIQWSYVANEPRTFAGVALVLFTALLLGRVVSEYHLTQWGTKKSETIEQKGNTLFFNRWRLGNIEVKSQINIWVSSIIPGVITYPLAYNQFGSSEDSQMRLILSCILVVYIFMLLVFSMVSHSKWVSSVCFALSIVEHFNMDEEGHEYIQIPDGEKGGEQIV